MVERYGSDPVSMKAWGIDYATRQVTDLFENSVKAVHIYSMNKPEVAKAILKNTSHLL